MGVSELSKHDFLWLVSVKEAKRGQGWGGYTSVKQQQKRGQGVGVGGVTRYFLWLWTCQYSPVKVCVCVGVGGGVSITLCDCAVLIFFQQFGAGGDDSFCDWSLVIISQSAKKVWKVNITFCDCSLSYKLWRIGDGVRVGGNIAFCHLCSVDQYPLASEGGRGELNITFSDY